MPGDMYVRVSQKILAEDALRGVFGEDVNRGPQQPIPAAFKRMVMRNKAWPGPTDMSLRVALETPVDFDIAAAMGRGEVKGLVLTVNRLSVYWGRELLGYTLRTDQLGLNAIATYWSLVNAHRAKA